MHPDIAAVIAGERRWCVVQADCRDVLPTLPERSVDHVITDPPYLLNFGNMVTAGRREDFTVRRGKLGRRDVGYAAFGADDVAAVGPLLGRLPRRWIAVWHDAESGHLWRAAIGERFVRTGSWVRTNPCPQFTGDRPGTGFELCTIAHAPGRLRWNGGGHAALWHHAALHGSLSEQTGHPTPKPLALMLEQVGQFTEPGDVIADPFCGGGTTGVAALRLGRRFIGIELDEKHAQTSRERLQAEDNGSTLALSRAGQQALFAGQGGQR